MENNKLQKARSDIDCIDTEMAELFCRRMKAVEAIALYKKEYGLPIADNTREEQIIRTRTEALESESDAIRESYVCFLRDTMAVSRRYQSRLMEGMRVAYSGTEGAFACIATKRIFPTAQSIAFCDFAEAYSSVVSGDCDAAVLPIENSSAGEVGQVTDLLFSGSLYINGCYDLAVMHDLLILPGANPNDITEVVSHPQALSQCAAFIRSHGYREHEYVNTAKAAEFVAESKNPYLAAIASEEAAHRYGLQIAAHGINEITNNTTRFAILSRVRNKIPESRDSDARFILTFTVRNEAGSLATAIDIIGRHGFNMESLRSRPMKQLLWQYYIYVEAEGCIDSENGHDMMRELADCCDKLKLVGSYRKSLDLKSDNPRI